MAISQTIPERYHFLIFKMENGAILFFKTNNFNRCLQAKGQYIKLDYFLTMLHRYRDFQICKMAIMHHLALLNIQKNLTANWSGWPIHVSLCEISSDFRQNVV